MSGRTIGAKPRPRALISRFDDDTANRIAQLFPTSRQIDESFDDIYLDEWDVLVLNKGGIAWLPAHIYVIGFGCESFGHPKKESGTFVVDFLVTYVRETLSQEFEIPEGLHPDVRILVERDLIPLVRARNRNAVLTEWTKHHQSPVGPTADWLTPFLLTTEPTVLAGSFLREGGKAQAWCISPGVEDPVPWVRAAMRVWHDLDPSRFPFDPGWPTDIRWMTVKEIELLASLRAVENERQSFLADSELREARLREEYAAVADEANHGLRRLLTAQGDDLVAAVQGALEALGFIVENRDLVNPQTDRLEDLWVISPADDPAWIALAEVKGYTGGAQLGALLSITGRFVPRFFGSEGRYPTRKWYVANQFIGRDPGARPTVLASNPDEVSEFASQDGLVVDTAALFSLVRDVEAGQIPQDVARRQLITAVGRFTYNPDA